MGMLKSAAVLPPLRRYREIAGVLIRHGLGDVASMLGIARFRTFARARPNLPASRNVRIRLALEELGPTFIKFGQALSVRGDLLPPDLVAELSKLQDDVPPLAIGVAEREIEAALNAPISDLFGAFDPKPVAAASIAQVHVAALSDGRLVAVKVRRPDIAPIIEDNLAALAHRDYPQRVSLIPQHSDSRVQSPPCLDGNEFCDSEQMHIASFLFSVRLLAKVA
jgi:ubiquinone biosynthesis protein